MEKFRTKFRTIRAIQVIKENVPDIMTMFDNSSLINNQEVLEIQIQTDNGILQLFEGDWIVSKDAEGVIVGFDDNTFHQWFSKS